MPIPQCAADHQARSQAGGSEGLTIRAPGVIGDVIKALGGTPAPTPAPETYDAMSKGVIQGAFMATESAKNWRFAEVAKYITNTWMVGPSYPFYTIINKNTYKKFSPEVRSIFDQLCGSTGSVMP